MNLPVAQPGPALKQRAYEALKERIVSCQLAPGQALSELSLAAELGMSRTPVREALVQLAQESLVRIEPRRGAFVAELSVRDVIEIFELREAVETWVVRKVAGSVPRATLQDFRGRFAVVSVDPEVERQQSVDADHEFHSYLVALTGNRRCETLFRQLQDQNQRIRVLATRQPGRLEESISEHLAIVDALDSRDREEAARAMALHIYHAQLAALRLAR